MNNKWREIYSDDESTWPEHNQWCMVVAFDEVREMKFISNKDTDDFIQIECGFVSNRDVLITPSSNLMIPNMELTTPCMKDGAEYGNVLWRPFEGEMK